MLTIHKPAVSAGLTLAAVFALPCAGMVATGGPRYLCTLLLPVLAYTGVRWQCRIAHTLGAARRAWAASAHLD